MQPGECATQKDLDYQRLVLSSKAYHTWQLLLAQSLSGHQNQTHQSSNGVVEHLVFSSTDVLLHHDHVISHQKNILSICTANRDD